MNTKLTLGLAAVAAAAALVAPSGASASMMHAGAAALSTAADEVAAHSGDAGLDITCQAQADGGAVTPETNFIVGKIFAQDIGIGQGKCISLNAKTYSITLRTKIQWFDGLVWRDVPGCITGTATATANQGVAIIPAQVTNPCNYGDASPYLDKYHRAFTTLTNTVDNVPRTDPSATWFQRRG